MPFLVFNTENGQAPVGDFVVADVNQYVPPITGSGSLVSQSATISGTGSQSGFVSDTFDGNGALGAHWLAHQPERRVSGTSRVNGYFEGDILVGENDGNITEWYAGLSGAYHYQEVDFPASGFTEFIIKGVGVGPVSTPQDNLPSNGGYAFAGVMAHVANSFAANSYEFAVVGHRGSTAATIETKSTLNSSSSVLDEGPNVFTGTGVTHGDIRIRLYSDSTVEFAYSDLDADSWTLINGTGSTPATNKPTFGSSVYIGLIIYAEGGLELPFTGTVSSFQKAPLFSVHTGTGALSSQPCQVSGAGVREVSGVGTLTSQNSAISGTGAREVSGSGSLTSQESSVSGAGTSSAPGSGDLISQVAQISGVGSREVSGTGTLTAQNSQVSGTGIKEVTGSGTLSSQDSVVSGSGTAIANYNIVADISVTLTIDSTFSMSSIHTGSGALASQEATVAGSGASSSEHTGTGTLASQAASLNGTGVATSPGTGDLVSQPGSISGVGSREVSGVGSLISQESNIAGIGGTLVSGTGALISQSGSVNGTGSRSSVGSGTLNSQTADVSGTGTSSATITGSGSLVSQPATLLGAGESITVGAGSLVSQPSEISGTGSREVVGAGSLISQPSTISGIGNIVGAIVGSGAMVASSSQISGSGVRNVAGVGSLIAASGNIVGYTVVTLPGGVLTLEVEDKTLEVTAN